MPPAQASARCSTIWLNNAALIWVNWPILGYKLEVKGHSANQELSLAAKLLRHALGM